MVENGMLRSKTEGSKLYEHFMHVIKRRLDFLLNVYPMGSRKQLKFPDKITSMINMV